MRGPTNAQAGSVSRAWRSAASAPGCTTRSGLQTRTHSGGRRLARQCGQAPVDAGAEAEVAAGPHQTHGRACGPLGKLRERGSGAPGGAVLHHDDRRSAVGEQGADAALEQRPGVVVDHDGADRAGHPALSTPW